MYGFDHILPIHLHSSPEFDKARRHRGEDGRGEERGGESEGDEEWQGSLADVADLDDTEDDEPALETAVGGGPCLAGLVAAASAISRFSHLASGRNRPRIEALLATAAATAPGYSLLRGHRDVIPARLVEEPDGTLSWRDQF